MDWAVSLYEINGCLTSGKEWLEDPIPNFYLVMVKVTEVRFCCCSIRKCIRFNFFLVLMYEYTHMLNYSHASRLRTVRQYLRIISMDASDGCLDEWLALRLACCFSHHSVIQFLGAVGSIGVNWSCLLVEELW